MKTMNKINAIKHARENVSAVYGFGDGYKFNSFDNRCNAWRESNAMPYYDALSARSQKLIDFARDAMDLPACEYDGGSLTNYLD